MFLYKYLNRQIWTIIADPDEAIKIVYPYPVYFELVDEKIILPLSQQNNKQTMSFFGKNRELERFIFQF